MRLASYICLISWIRPHGNETLALFRSLPIMHPLNYFQFCLSSYTKSDFSGYHNLQSTICELLQSK
jgi:hypothetical protein